ncbi:polysaccharide deacetylase family protein [Bacillus suaedae]|uniref:Polysaccharide deacetylase family protein n=1 Tax=Halalkalibacter suaedae TaxID=2822140 RepID=A0A941AMN4_9BACI|nr:polysaccharide deacetylase family protein [Bacillus suaedae]
MVKNKQAEIILTFDDGPTNLLDDILTILNKNKVQALFFWQTGMLPSGNKLEKVLSDGHLIGTHSHSHRILTELSYEEQYNEMLKSKILLEQALHEPIRLFRPPYGLYNDETFKVAKALNLEIVLWSVASWDWKHPKDPHQIIENVVDHIEAGHTVLLHELPQTVTILDSLIREIRKKNLTFSSPHTVVQLEGNDTR